jgi:hypothetical protein
MDYGGAVHRRRNLLSFAGFLALTFLGVSMRNRSGKILIAPVGLKPLKAGALMAMLGLGVLATAGAWLAIAPGRPKIVLALNSGACGCAKGKCASLESAMKNFLSFSGYADKVELQVVDINPDSPGRKWRTWGRGKADLLAGAGHPVMKKYGMESVPGLAVVDGRDKVKYMTSYFDQAQISASLQAILAEN